MYFVLEAINSVKNQNTYRDELEGQLEYTDLNEVFVDTDVAFQNRFEIPAFHFEGGYNQGDATDEETKAFADTNPTLVSYDIDEDGEIEFDFEGLDIEWVEMYKDKATQAIEKEKAIIEGK